MNLLRLASEQVPRGIYALEKDKVIEMRNDKCNSVTQVKSLKRQFKKAASWVILLCSLQNRRLNICHNLDQNIISCTNISNTQKQS